MRLFVILALMGLLFVPAVRSVAGDKEELKVEGKLTADDPKDKMLKKSPHKVHTFKMKAGTIYVIDMVGKGFDTFLRLEDSAGRQVAENDDVSLKEKNLNSRIAYKATKDDSYRIIATSYEGATGAYSLTVRKGTQEDLDNFAKSDPFFPILNKQAPALTSEFSFNGDTKKLSDLKGKVVLLDFWAVWCPPCIDTFPDLRDWSKFQKDGLEIVGVTTYFEQLTFDKDKGVVKKAERNLKANEEHDMLKDFASHHKLTHRMLTVSQANWKKAWEDYMIGGIPHVVLVDRKGLVRMVRVGFSEANAQALHSEIKNLLAEK